VPVLEDPSTRAAFPMYTLIDDAFAVGAEGVASGSGVGVPDDPPDEEVPVDESGWPEDPPLEEEGSSSPQPAVQTVRGATVRNRRATDRRFRMVRGNIPTWLRRKSTFVVRVMIGGRMRLVCLHDRDVIEAVLRRDPEVHLYEIGDLDDFFWPLTTWYGLEDRGTLRNVALVYAGSDLPVVVALAREGQTWGVTSLLERMRPVLPRKFYAHLAVGTSKTLAATHSVDPHGLHVRMMVKDWSALERIDTSRAVPLGPTDARELEELYADAYPANWFDGRMLETGAYFGVREGEVLASVSGVHVVSRAKRVAALGNVATRPELRGRGLARIAVAATLRALRSDVDHLGLNVDTANAEGIRLYEGLGFARVATYEEARIG
jgi:ribosomal protein S18 acetylase RimI-like enzyme